MREDPATTVRGYRLNAPPRGLLLEECLPGRYPSGGPGAALHCAATGPGAAVPVPARWRRSFHPGRGLAAGGECCP
ncbi:hypothetical protein ABIA33_004740 [Streptacidiphilus sp. MAP12-16]|uniref:hypothetical protein n=1 Tax=Streptacidiphilus sp. MAP12-16 TaxID=3156300 RepID=UPI0035198350